MWKTVPGKWEFMFSFVFIIFFLIQLNKKETPALWRVHFPHLHFGVDAVGDLVPELTGTGVGLGQQERVRQGAILRLHDLPGQSRAERVERHREKGKGGKTDAMENMTEGVKLFFPRSWPDFFFFCRF